MNAENENDVSNTSSTILQMSQIVEDYKLKESRILKEICVEENKPHSVNMLLIQAAQNNDRQELEALLELNKNIDISTLCNQKQYTILHFSAFNNQQEALVQIIQMWFIFRNVITHYARFLEKTNQDVESKLTDFINLQTSEGFTALHFASYRGNIAMLEYLVSLGANINLTNEHGMNIMHIGAQGDQPISVIFAHTKGKQIINKSKGIKLTTLDKKGGSALHWSCFYGCEQSSIYILALLPDSKPYWPLNQLDQQLLTPLHLTVMSGNTRLVKKLLLAGADKTIRGKEGQTSAQIAKEHDYTNIYQMLTTKETFFIKIYNLKQRFTRVRRSNFELIRFAIILIYQFGTYWYFTVDTEKIFEDKIVISTLALLTASLLLFTIIVCVDPGTRQPMRQSLLELLKNNECFDICPVCRVIKLPRSKHCEICQKCVLVYDHHCPWLNTCVGARNHFLFLMFVIVIFAALTISMYSVLDALINNQSIVPLFDFQKSNRYIRYIFLLSNLLFGFIFWVALLLLIFTQTVNFLIGKTTLERLVYIFIIQNRFAQNIRPSQISSHVRSDPLSQKISLLDEEVNSPKNKYSLTNCFNMCFNNYITYRQKERALMKG